MLSWMDVLFDLNQEEICLWFEMFRCFLDGIQFDSEPQSYVNGLFIPLGLIRTTHYVLTLIIAVKPK